MQYTSGPPGLGLLPSHVALLQQELPRLGYRLFTWWCWDDLAPHDHLAVIASLRAEIGVRLARKTAPDWPLHERLLEAYRLGLLPAVVHVEILAEVLGAPEISGDYIVGQIHLRPAGTTPIILIDAANLVALTWAMVDIWRGDS